jgi:hypothetical protein
VWTVAEPNWSLEFLDFPTAWWIQGQGVTHTDPVCSAEQTDGALLCDCGAVTAEWERRRAAHQATGEADHG